MGAPFLWHAKFGTLQFVVLKPILALISFVCQLAGVLGDGTFKFDVAYPYLSFVASTSQVCFDFFPACH